MTTHGMHERACRNWQFSLRGLLFVTTIVAMAAAIVSVSVALAMLLVPLMALGLLRTIRIAARQEAARGAKTRLLATFSKSILLIVATIAIGMATIAVAGMAGVLATLMVAIHVLRAARRIARPIGRRLGRLLVQATKKGAMVVSRMEPVAILRWLEVQAVGGTLTLVALCRRLCAQCWNANGAGKSPALSRQLSARWPRLWPRAGL